MRFDLSLTQDLCARLCHDLGGPLGSVSGALDLIGPVDEAALVDALVAMREALGGLELQIPPRTDPARDPFA